MKKFVSVILILAMLFSFASCGETTAKPEISEGQVDPVPVDVSEELYIVDGARNKYYPGDTITKSYVQSESNYSYSVMVNEHLFRDFSLIVDDEEVSSFKSNGAGNILVKTLKNGNTSFTIDTGNNKFTFTWVNGNNTIVPIVKDKEENSINGESIDVDPKENVKTFIGLTSGLGIGDVFNGILKKKNFKTSHNGYQNYMLHKSGEVEITKEEIDSVLVMKKQYPKTVSYDVADSDSIKRVYTQIGHK